MELQDEIEMYEYEGGASKDEYIQQMQAKLDAVEKQIKENEKAQKMAEEKGEGKHYYQPKGKVVNPRAAPPVPKPLVVKKKEVQLPNQNQIVEDEKILNMLKPLTVERLNMMFTERQDVFEFPQEKPDWKYPKYVKIEKTKRYKQQEIDHYNEMQVTKQNMKYDAINNFYEDDDIYQVQNQLQQNAKEAEKNLNQKPKVLDESDIFLSKIITSWKTIFSMTALMCNITYYIHINFASGLLRLIYLVFVLMYPVSSFIANVVIGNNLSNIVLDKQDTLPQNAEYLDFEDNDEDILRKAKILAIKRRVRLQYFAMTPLFLTGFFKVISEVDFPMQIYAGYIIEMCTLSLPILILQGINNAMLEKFQLNQLEIFFSMGILAINLLIDLRGIITIGDKMTQESNERQRRQVIRKHQRQKQLQLQQQKIKHGIATEADLLIEDDDDYLTDDPWKSTSFSTQRIFRQTVKISILAAAILTTIIVISTLGVFSEECGTGYYEFVPNEADETDANKFFTFIDANICSKCEHQNCKSCQISQGIGCDSCNPGYFKLQGYCQQCVSQEDACAECENNSICTKCKDGYTLREFTMEDDGSKTKECVKCPTDDGCDQCSDNICKTCKPGYFLSEDNLCYKCRAYQDGCDQCDNLHTCQKCSNQGYTLFTDTNQCGCNTDQGFIKNQESRKCQCKDQTYNVRSPTKSQVCATCSELYPGCKQCIQSTTYSLGAIEYQTDNGPLYINCNTCLDFFIYDPQNKQCVTCRQKWGAQCNRCDANACLGCRKGFFLNAARTKCVECGLYFDNCDQCSREECEECSECYRKNLFNTCVKKLFC